MLPAGELMIEHRLIERMVAAIGKESKRLEQGGAIDAPFLFTAVDFFRTYADRCHHGKEENILFAKLSSKPMTAPLKEMMDRLIAEHVTARRLVGEVASEVMTSRAGHTPSRERVSSILFELSQLYPAHIATEDKQFFPAAMKYLDDDERGKMLRDFEDLERTLLHEKYHAVVEGAEKR
jgi:hemerythrin-like domain-containing protein